MIKESQASEKNEKKKITIDDRETEKMSDGEGDDTGN